MKDGFYLSTYFDIDELAHIYGISRRHDSNISLWLKKENNIELVHFWELERISGLKHHELAFYDREHAEEIINSLLKTYNISLSDINEIWGSPHIGGEKYYCPESESSNIAYHSIAHLFSSVCLDSKIFYGEKIIGFAVDGGPDTVLDTKAKEKYHYAGCYINKGEIELFPVCSPGYLWMMMAGKFKLEEGSLMALASASKSEAYVYPDEIYLMKDMNNAKKFLPKFNDYVNKIFNLSEKDKGELFNFFDPNFSIEDNKISMVVKEMQKMSIKIMEYNVDEVLKRYNISAKDTYLALAGGYALNCPTNSHLMQYYKFKGFMAPPCVNDGGISLGVALYEFYRRIKPINFLFKGSYHGDCIDNLDLIVKEKFYEKYIKNIENFNAVQAANDIDNEPIVWLNGRAEIGPRALGNRSILASARTLESKDRLNIIKKRQWWRPVAPIIIEKYLNEWFEDAYPSPYMLHTFTLKANKRDLVPAIVHLDDSARIQSISGAGMNNVLYSVLEEYYKITGVPMICNTSLNDKGEPVINTLEEALNFALRKGIKIVYINGKRLELHNHESYPLEIPLKRRQDFIKYTEENSREILEKLNPHGLTKEAIKYYYDVPSLYQTKKLTNMSDAREVYVATKLDDVYNSFV